MTRLDEMSDTRRSYTDVPCESVRVCKMALRKALKERIRPEEDCWHRQLCHILPDLCNVSTRSKAPRVQSRTYAKGIAAYTELAHEASNSAKDGDRFVHPLAVLVYERHCGKGDDGSLRA